MGENLLDEKAKKGLYIVDARLAEMRG